jgi:hypothetical protein
MPTDSTQVLNVLSDPEKLIGIIVGLFTIIGGLYAAITKVLPWWRTWRDRRSLRKRLGAELYTPEDILRATTYYIRPNCQNVDPAGSEEMRQAYAVIEDLFKAMDRLLDSPAEHKYAILLADSGMGKTSFVLNYYVHHWRKRKRFGLALVPSASLMRRITSTTSKRLPTPRRPFSLSMRSTRIRAPSAIIASVSAGFSSYAVIFARS